MVAKMSITDDQMKQIFKFISKGNDLEYVAALVGVPIVVLLKVLEDGRNEESRIANGLKPNIAMIDALTLYSGVKKATAKFVKSNLDNIREASKEDWKASVWLLETFNPSRFAKMADRKIMQELLDKPFRELEG